MPKGYGQFCPVAQASEILAERWTPLVIRELLCGSHRFNDIHRGVPLMSPSLLSQRLKRLEDAGVVVRHRGTGETATEYRLTHAGQALGPVIEGLGSWGKRWARRKIPREELDPGLLMWDIHRRLVIEKFPEGRTVLHFELTDVPSRRRYYWLVIDRGTVDVCLKDPGFEVDVYINTDLATLTDVWMGDLPLDTALEKEWIRLSGPRALTRRFRSWLMLSEFAGVERESGAPAAS